MAPTPVFVASVDLVKSRLRLSGLPDSFDGEAITLDAISAARVKFHRRLGQARVAELVGFASTDDPVTDEQMLRRCAELVEVKIVRLELMRTLRIFFVEGADPSDPAWNTEGILRDATSEEGSKMMLALQADIEQDLSYLAGDQVPGEETLVQATTYEADEAPPRPGDSIYARTTVPW